MPKRKYSAKISYYEEKLRKLKESGKSRPPRRNRIIIYSDSDEENDNSGNGISAPSTTATDPPATDESRNANDVPVEDTTPVAPEIDNEFLEALGDLPDKKPTYEYGKKIHQNLADRWLPILRHGLSTENKDSLLKELTIPENCKLLRAPILNTEISAAITESTRARDKEFEKAQQQLGLGISAINRALTLLVTGCDDKESMVKVIKMLSDSCRVLTDLHFVETQGRIKAITPALDKAFVHVVEDVERDESLFGMKLSDKIKASKAIEKQELQIKKAAPPQKPAPSPSQSTTRTCYPGNCTAPSRHQSPNKEEEGQSTEDPDIDLQDSPCSTSTADQEQQPEQARCSPELISVASPVLQREYPGCSEVIRLAFVKRGTPSAALELMIASLTHNTLLQYNATFEPWWLFCKNNNFHPIEAPISQVLLFLTEQIDKGVAYGSLNTHRSALSFLLGSEVRENGQIKRLLKGAYRLRPTIPKYSATWDPQIVINFVSNWYPNNSVPLEQITKKLAVLLVLCTAQKVQTLSLIKINNVTSSTGGVKIIISDLIKTSARSRKQPIMFLPYFEQNKRICPATTLMDYLEVTQLLRAEGTLNLFLAYKRPYKIASAQTITRWVKQTLSASGVDVSVYGAHSSRHASTSAASATGSSIDAIRKAAGWTKSSETFARFYQRPVCNDSSFAYQSDLSESNDD